MATILINGVQYSDVPEIDVPKAGGGTAKFHDASGADFNAADLLTGKSAVGASGLVNGSMPENGALSGEIETKNGTYTIPAGHTSGGSVGLKASAIEDCISANILRNKRILGIDGGLTVPTISQNSTTKILSIS